MSRNLYSFDDFVSGPANLLAANAARRVAELPGGVYNPLVVRGESGVGKTHLLNALALAASELDPDLDLRIESGVMLAERFTTGIALREVAAVRETLAALDLLLIDDLDQLGGLIATQRELVPIIGEMLASGRQVVVSTTAAPAELAGFIPELQALLGRGLLVDLELPDEITRRGIATLFARRRDLDAAPAVLDSLARLGPADLSRLELAVGRLALLAEELDRPLLPGDVHRILEDPGQSGGRRNEFGAFLQDVSVALAAVVESAPWRRRVAEGILQWESAGIRTTRLDEALEADTAPDVDALLESFARDANRLLEIRARLGARADAERLDDPEDLVHAEALLLALDRDAADALQRDPELGAGSGADQEEGLVQLDPIFLDPARVVLSYVDVEGRLAEELA